MDHEIPPKGFPQKAQAGIRAAKAFQEQRSSKTHGLLSETWIVVFAFVWKGAFSLVTLYLQGCHPGSGAFILAS